MKKITIIGAGHVGSHCAYALCFKGVCDEIALIDKDREKALSNANDVADATLYWDTDTYVHLGDYSDIVDSDIIVISIGTPRLPGQTRLDMLDDAIIESKEVISHLKDIPFDGVMITITNPADIIADYFRKNLNLSRERCFSTGTTLDTARLKRTVSECTGVSSKKIDAFSMGEHGNSSIISFSNMKIDGVPYDKYKSSNKDPKLDKAYILNETRQIGNRIIDGKGSTEFGIGAVLCSVAKCVLYDEKKVFTPSILLNGEYGINDVHAGVPCVIGKNGIEEIMEINLSNDEKSEFLTSCDVVRTHILRAEKL